MPPKQANVSGVGILLIGFTLFCLSWLATLLITHWDVAGTLLYESSLAKYEMMSGQRGPVTFLVFHDNLEVLSELADLHEGILGVEQHSKSNVAKIAFNSIDSPLIEVVRQLPQVESMINKRVPMLCH